jgi:Protein of unknown function (DUF2934)
MKPATEMLEEAIRKRAYYLWEASGQPQGRDQEFWALACEQIAIEGNRSASQLANAVVQDAAPTSQSEPVKQSPPAKKQPNAPAKISAHGERKRTTPQRRRKS